MEDASTGHDHTTNPTMTEALATTKDMHPVMLGDAHWFNCS